MIGKLQRETRNAEDLSGMRFTPLSRAAASAAPKSSPAPCLAPRTSSISEFGVRRDGPSNMLPLRTPVQLTTQ
jgi:hypothetical protein